jgi:hypothetical protein
MMNTREEWLTEAANKLRMGVFKRSQYDVPQVRLAIGFPGGGSAKKRIGEYWKGIACQDGMPQIFISPTLSCPIEILDTLTHELVHAVVPNAGHGKEFRKVALSVGLTGKMRSTVAGPELKAELESLSSLLGPLPHAGINLGNGRKKQSTRLIKCECLSCGYTVRTTAKWIEIGMPLCPCNNEPMQAAQ